MWSSAVWNPFSICFYQGVCEFDELPHYRCKSYFLWFATFDHGLVFVAHVGVVSGCNESRHVERVTQLFSAALNSGLAAPVSRLPGHRCQPSEACNLLFLERSDLRHFDENSCGSDLTNTWDRSKNCVGSGSAWAVLQPFIYVVLQCLQLTRYLIYSRFRLPLHECKALRVETIRVKTDPWLRPSDLPNVFAAGDVAEAGDAMTIVAVSRQTPWLEKMLTSLINGKKVEVMAKYKPWGKAPFLVPLGPQKGIPISSCLPPEIK